jgi:hypothetical protein
VCRPLGKASSQQFTRKSHTYQEMFWTCARLVFDMLQVVGPVSSFLLYLRMGKTQRKWQVSRADTLGVWVEMTLLLFNHQLAHASVLVICHSF